MLDRLRSLASVIFRIGLSNVFAVAVYRFAIRLGLAKILLRKGESYNESLFRPQSTPHSGIRENRYGALSDDSPVTVAEELLSGTYTCFSFHKVRIGSPPNWFRNPLTQQTHPDPRRHWSMIGDFDFRGDDIKVVWDISRFDWALVLARAFRVSGDSRFLKTLNEWSTDWIENNPLNIGPNWKCGQESAIRMLQVLLTAFLLNQHKHPTHALLRFISEHCSRIEPTIRYAIAQNNNHGTSEASALFIGGAWLEKYAVKKSLRQKGLRWKNKGRRWLENRMRKLVAADGSFSQYSVNYHRLFVDTLNIVEFWRRELGLKRFSKLFESRCRSAVLWLFYMVDVKSGDAPNLGANDGARLFVLSNTEYRDFRPSVQLGAHLFLGGRLYPEGPWDEPCLWLKLNDSHVPDLNVRKESRELPGGGYVVFHGERDMWGVLRYPRYRFRPGHADAFHFDLWHGGGNVLRDSGTFSYNTREPWQGYFSSTKAHNTVEFDGRDQMPALTRFMRAAWLEMDSAGKLQTRDGRTSWTGSYCDKFGSRHKRTVINKGSTFTIIDELDGIKSVAILRWRLMPGKWNTSGQRCFGETCEIAISADVPITGFELSEGWESRYYFNKSRLPVLEVEVRSKAAIITSFINLKHMS